MMVHRFASAALFLLVSAASGLAQHSTARLEILVSSHSTGNRLSGVQVSIDELKLHGITDDRGTVVLEGIPPGVHVARIRSVGYRTELVPAEFAPGARVEAEVDLLWKAIELTDVTIEGKQLSSALSSVGFYDRQASTGGVFLTSEMWAGSPGVGLLSVLASVPGIRIGRFKTQWGRYASRVYSGRSKVTMSGGGRMCWSKVYVDGTPQYDSDEDPLDLNALRTDQIGAVEIYRGPSETPPMFGTTGSACGVILLWSKSRLEVEARIPKESSTEPRLDLDAPVPTPRIPHS